MLSVFNDANTDVHMPICRQDCAPNVSIGATKRFALFYNLVGVIVTVLESFLTRISASSKLIQPGRGFVV